MAANGALHKDAGVGWHGFKFGWHGACFALRQETVATSRNGTTKNDFDPTTRSHIWFGR
jgi:hypothetical protein